MSEPFPTEPISDGHEGNPFSTKHFAPGKLEFRFPPGHSFETLLQRWETAGRRGEIVGPHGSGKSTLLAGMIPLLERRERRVLFLELHDGARTLPLSDDSFRNMGANDDLFVDGYEQLSHFSRLQVRRFVRRRDCGLLVTTHRSVGFPTLLTTATDPALTKALVARLTSVEWRKKFDAQIEQAFTKHNGNLREVFFDLYDLFEQS